MRSAECVERGGRQDKKEGEEARGRRGSERKRRDKKHRTQPIHCIASNAVKRVGACVRGATGRLHQCHFQATATTHTATRLLLQPHTTYTLYSYTGACVRGGTLPNTLPQRLVERKTSEQVEHARESRPHMRGSDGEDAEAGDGKGRGERGREGRSTRHSLAALALTQAAYS